MVHGTSSIAIKRNRKNGSHGSQLRSRSPTRRALRRIGLGDSDQSRAIRVKCYIETSKNSEKITNNLKKMWTSTFMYHMSKNIT